MKSVSDNHRFLLEEISDMFYMQHMNQQEIASKLFISRSQISRLLQEARDLGIVQIAIHYSAKRNYSMEEQLKSRFGLNTARVMSPYQESDTDERFFQMGAELVKDAIHSNTVVGITWGSSVSGVIRALRPSKEESGIDVVQVMGSSMLENQGVDAQELVRILAKHYGGNPHYIPAPLAVPSVSVRNALLEDAHVARTLELASFSDVLLTGIGTFRDVMISKHSWLGYMTPNMLMELKLKHAVGSICARFFDANGKLIDCEWNDRCMGITLDNIRRMDNIIGVARGVGKADAILAALRGHVLTSLITDNETCAAILERSF